MRFCRSSKVLRYSSGRQALGGYPLLFILGIWRHIYKRLPLVYDPQYWGMIFPLGMYTACTLQLSKAINFEYLLLIPRYFVYVALAAWLAAFIRLIRSFRF